MQTSINDQALAALSAIDPVAYAAERNYLGKSTRLSVYVTRGVLTLPQIRDYLSAKFTEQQNNKLIFELAWREYWQREWSVRGDAVFSDIKRPQEDVESSELPIAVADARTGIDALDIGIRDLYQTGYIHNHMRMWLSGLVCNIAHTGWQKPAWWMYYYLLDGDPASNMLSWQWVAGTFSSKRYLPAQENINRYAKSSQTGTFLDHTYDTLATMETPEMLQARQTSDLTWDAPKADQVHIDTSKPTLLYHCFWLNADWYHELDANRVLVLEPRWFERFPVSDKVTQMILRIAKEVPGMQLFVGNIEELQPMLKDDMTYVAHPSVKHWPGRAEAMPMLFPDVPLRSYNSFTSFWKQCEKQR